MVVICCFLVVALRSYVGMSAAFPWKNTVFMGSGMCCGLSQAVRRREDCWLTRIGIYRAVVGSLILAALMYGFGRVFGERGVISPFYFLT